MEWDVELTAECQDWYMSLTEAEAESVSFVVDLLVSQGPQLKTPYSSQIKGSRFGQLRELRVSSTPGGHTESSTLSIPVAPPCCSWAVTRLGIIAGTSEWYREPKPSWTNIFETSAHDR